jgi:hypothetical protein
MITVRWKVANGIKREDFEAWVMLNARNGTHVQQSRNGSYMDNRVMGKWSAWFECSKRAELIHGELQKARALLRESAIMLHPEDDLHQQINAFLKDADEDPPN